MGEQFTDLMKLAIELNANDYHVFVEFSGHCELIIVSVHHGGWKEKSTVDGRFERYGYGDAAPGCETYAAIDWLTEDHAKFREAKSA